MTPPARAEQLAGHLREQIASGELAPGVFVTRAELLAHHNASPATVRSVLDQLSADKVVDRQRGGGARVTCVPSARPIADLVGAAPAGTVRERIAQTLTGLLDSESYRPGTVIAVRELAGDFGASVNSARWAVEFSKERGRLANCEFCGIVVQPRTGGEGCPAAWSHRSSSGRDLKHVISSELRMRVLLGRYAANTALPTVAVLAEEFQVSAGLIAAALQPLKDDGLVHALHGHGTFVTGEADRIPASTAVTATGSAAESLRKLISSGVWCPGTLMTTSELRRRHEGAVSDFDAAIDEMRSERLIEYHERFAWRVNPREAGWCPPHGMTRLEHLTGQIRKRLTDGLYSGPLPRAEIAFAFSLSSWSVHSAVQILRSEGLVRMRRRRTWVEPAAVQRHSPSASAPPVSRLPHVPHTEAINAT